MFKQQIEKSESRELRNLTDSGFQTVFAENIIAEHFSLIEEKQKNLAYLIKGFGFDLAEKGWNRGVKKGVGIGLAAGLFFGFLSTLFIYEAYISTFNQELENRVLDCVKIETEYPTDHISDCIQGEFPE